MSKHDKVAKLKEYIKNFVIKELEKDEELDEASTTASAGAANPMGTGIYYDTPKAFSGKRKKDKKKRKKIATAGGYKPVKESINESQPFADFPQFPKLSRDQQESLDELFGFAESYQIFNSFNNNPKKFIQTLDDMAKIRKASNKQPKGVNFNKGKKQFVKEATKQEVNALKKFIKDFQKMEQQYWKIAKMGDKELTNVKYNKHYETILAATKSIAQLGREIQEKERIGEGLNEVTKQEVSALQKLHKGLEKLKNDYIKIAKVGDKTLMDREYNNYYETILTARKEIGKLLIIMKNKELLGEGRYHDWRNDESLTPKQKIGKSMREIRDALNELDKTVKMNLKLKTELKMKSEDYWKNTHKALTKISERLVKMANKVGNLK